MAHDQPVVPWLLNGTPVDEPPGDHIPAYPDHYSFYGFYSGGGALMLSAPLGTHET